MLPNITYEASNKKIPIPGTEDLVKQWGDVKKQLQQKAKSSSNKITSALINDFFKVCKLKQISQFYSNYLVYFTADLDEARQSSIFKNEIDNLINNRSHFHIIRDILLQRQNLLLNADKFMELVEGFIAVNSNKSCKSGVKQKINQMLSTATSLQQINEIQKKQISLLATAIIDIRKNTIKMIEQVKKWRQFLLGLHNNSPRRNKLKVIFPKAAINCLLLPLYDQVFILTSFLKDHFQISEKNNPFILLGKQSKKSSQLQEIFREEMKKDQQQYEEYTQYILAEVPKSEGKDELDKQNPKNRVNELKFSFEKKSSIGRKQDQPSKREINNSIESQKRTNSPRKSKKQLNIQNILLKYRKSKKKKSIVDATENKQESIVNQDDMRGKQSIINSSQASPSNKNDKEKQLINNYGSEKHKRTISDGDKIRKILDEKAYLQKQLREANVKNKQYEALVKKIEKEQSKLQSSHASIKKSDFKSVDGKDNADKQQRDGNKIMAIYGQKMKKHKRPERSFDQEKSVQSLENEKKSLEKELKHEIREKIKLERMLKRTQKELNKQLNSSKAQKERLESEIVDLKRSRSKDGNSKLQNYDDDVLKKSRASIISMYTKQEQKNNRVQMANLNLYDSRLAEQKNQRLNLEKQVKQLLREKTKLERVIQKSSQVQNKEKQTSEKRIKRYEEAIQKLNQQHSLLKQKGGESKDVAKGVSRLRMYTASPLKLQQQLKIQTGQKRNSKEHTKSASYLKSPSQSKKSKYQTPIMERQVEKSEGSYSRRINKVEIIQTKKTIEIVYDSGRKSMSQKQSKMSQYAKSSGRSPKKDPQLEKIRKQNESLLERLADDSARRRDRLFDKSSREERLIENYRSILEKEKDKKYQLQRKLKELKRQLYNEFEQRLRNEKDRFREQKKELIRMIEEEKGENKLKQKHIMNQVRFLNEMTENQKYLMSLLEAERKSRMEKQKELALQIAKREQLLKVLQIEEIKKGIESEIRKQFQNQIQLQQLEEKEIEERKERLKLEIEELNVERTAELQEIDEQNQKLKNLIAKIKEEETKVMMAIHENVNETDPSQLQQRLTTGEKEVFERSMNRGEKLKSPNKMKTEGEYVNRPQTKLLDSGLGKNASVDLEHTQKVFQKRLNEQIEHQIQIKKAYRQIKESPQFKEKEQVQNLIQKYLNEPHVYPPNKDKKLSNEEKQQISHVVYNKSKLAGDFERELNQLKELQKIVPTSQNDIMTSHLLNLRQAYENKESSALKDELFPLIKQDEVYFESELSYEDEEVVPPATLEQDIKDHGLKHQKRKNSHSNSKNFMAINRMKLAEIQQQRKEKEKQFIEQQARKRVQSQMMKRNNFKRKQEERARKAEERKKKQQENKKLREERKTLEAKLKQTHDQPRKSDPKIKNEKSKEKGTATSAKKLSNTISYPMKKDKNKAAKDSQQLKGEQTNERNNTQQKVEIQVRETEQNLAQISENKQQQSQNGQISQQNGIEKGEEDKQKLKSQQNAAQQSHDSYQEYEVYEEQQKPVQQNKQKETEKEETNQNWKGNEEEVNNQLLEINDKDKELEKEKMILEEDVHQFQEQIRSYISGEEKFEIYQQFIEAAEIGSYVQNLLSISSEQVKGLNNNPNLKEEITTYKSIAILVARQRKNNLQVGIAIFHKERQTGNYICDYVLAHNMKNFLNLLFNFSRYIFYVDQFSNKTEYFFDLTNLKDEISILNFIEFEEKCKRLGEVYVKVGSDKTRKYVLRRNLFESLEKQREKKISPIQFNLNIEVHSDYLTERGKGFVNSKKVEYISTTALMSLYLKKKDEILENFRKSAEDDLKHRELLLTALMFLKKQVQIKNVLIRELAIEKRLQLSKIYHYFFSIQDPTHPVNELQFNLEHQLNQKTKRSTLEIDDKSINYLVYYPEEAITKIQSSNSSQTGVFLSLIPKFKVLIIEANEFIQMNKVNPEVNAFFYVKHFIKNMLDVRKEEHPRIFVPEIQEQNQVFLKDLSQKMKQTVIVRENISLGWANQLNNSIVDNPSHKDLVIKKPFIISLLSATVERIIQGTPLCATVIL